MMLRESAPPPGDKEAAFCFFKLPWTAQVSNSMYLCGVSSLTGLTRHSARRTSCVCVSLSLSHLQGLYGHVESEVSEWPTGATRVSRLVFIGDLSPRVQDALRAGVRSCLAAPRARPPPPKVRPPPSAAAGRTSGGGGGGGFASRLGSVKFGGGGSEDLFL